VSQALFIPAFFLATGFLVDLRLLGMTTLTRPVLVFGLIAALCLGKYLAARGSGLFFAAMRPHARLVWSLSLPQMAAALAAAVVAYKTVHTAGERLRGDAYVNGALVVVTCVVGPILTERFARECEVLDLPEARKSGAR
jgi:Kef-type K+ transport system membrane component KefB